MRRIFISGHLDLTIDEFNLHYAPLIEKEWEAGSSFVVGDARGADVMAQERLGSLGAQVTIYHMFASPRNNPCGFPIVGGFVSDADRDIAMINASDRTLAWVRPGREKSGTAQNLRR